jgi:hypothetical protein
MTPKEKAQEIRDKFYFETTITELEEAKECALITVNELIIQDWQYREFWQIVKKELIEL